MDAIEIERPGLSMTVQLDEHGYHVQHTIDRLDGEVTIRHRLTHTLTEQDHAHPAPRVAVSVTELHEIEHDGEIIWRVPVHPK